MTAIPAPRRETAHWCAQCRDCPSCQGGRDPFPRAWIPHITPTGLVKALCCDCGGAAVLCPTLDGAQVSL